MRSVDLRSRSGRHFQMVEGGPLEWLRRSIWTLILGQDAGSHGADFYELA